MSCNGSSLQESLLKSLSYDAEEPSSSVKRKTDVEKWAALLATGVAQAQTCATSGGPFVGSPPEAWRSDVELLTPSVEAANGSELTAHVQALREQTQTPRGADDEQNRIQVRVNVGELGELALVVERSATGVKIQISAQDSRILEAMAVEREALTTALSGIGQSVTSLAFVAMDRVGINLAQPRMSFSHPARTQRNDNDSDCETPHEKRKSRRINVVG
jgi:hypothetical protein